MDKHNNSEIQKKEIRKKLGLPPKNPTDSSKNKDDKLVTVEIQKEFDVLDKAWENKVFVKLFVAARTSGLLRKISDREFKTLIALALYMDEYGNCYPSQYQIARDLGCSRETVNRRVQSLLRFRFNGKPVVTSVKVRNEEGKWENTRYTILPISKLKIFEKPLNKELDVEPVSHVTKTSHGPCDDIATRQNRHTNHNNILTLNNNQLNNVKENAVFNKGKRKKRSPEKESLANYIAEQLEDDHSLGFYRKIVDLIPEDIIYIALSEVKDTHLTGKIIKSKAALFNTVIQNKAREHNINLNIKKTGRYDK